MDELQRELESLERDVQQGRLKLADLATKKEEVTQKHQLKLLQQMFSSNDIGESVIFDVYSANKRKIGESIDTLLELSTSQSSQKDKNNIPTTVPTSQIQKNGTNGVPSSIPSSVGQLPHAEPPVTIVPSGYQIPQPSTKPVSNSTEQVIYVNNTPNYSQDHFLKNNKANGKENYENGKESPVPIPTTVIPTEEEVHKF